MSAINVFIWTPIFGLPSSSPFCLKVLAALRYKGIEHQVTVLDRSPSWVQRGKLPVIKINDTIIEDSTNILKRLDEIYPHTSSLYPLDPGERAETLLLEDWSDESLYWFLVYSRWAINEHFEPFKAEAFQGLPYPLRRIIPPLIRQTMIKRLQAQGIAKLPHKERIKRFQEACWCLEQRLQNRDYLINDRLTAADLAIYSQLQIIARSRFKDLFPALKKQGLLMAWLTRVESCLETTKQLRFATEIIAK
ncbi:MAG: glutathione S-transferase N-terminal domain-containing protein [Microcystis sp. M015S2]|uniref:glutathione S-transferase family protein n=1 Tax=unclassified Microcystis TaxID=2643300 RepID=UPI0022BBA9F3|nr:MULTISPECIES: Tom37 metaxin N-terminal-like domain-containing protein [unclassified Microcystis]MCZ8306440.1 glutathione S-transferase N-terminal domain-containing protein [Microcystis sp. LE19-98.1E]MCA2693147.1 glutathione S-transferase N-terminal domain-containing protein [Microcystis sp. M034S2]MCA2711289.1 glutathione S-transferase N-terminal domain-containing protein [Microcystis sp. M025S2]MCA2743586.1 glutathione S-transferase N-terminal domain-containing protein [Microcystis sp. M01